MNAITRRQALTCGVAAIPLLKATNAIAAGPTERDISKLVNDALASWEVPGVAVGIVRDDRVVHLAGYGVQALGGKVPVTRDTLFPIASCTKAFTTTVMAKLVSERKMWWDDPVRNYLEYFRLSDPSADRLVTLRDLVCHRTGLGSHDLLWYHAAWSQRDAVRRIGRVAPNLHFRSSFEYQTTMVAAAGYAVEAVLGKGATWDGYVRKIITGPLEMNRTFFTTKEAFAHKDIATPHRENRKEKLEPVAWYEYGEPDPAGSIISCARDLCSWAQFHLCSWAQFHLRLGKVARNGKEISLVPPAALAETHSPQNIIPLDARSIDRLLNPETDHMAYCMGWVRHDYRGRLVLAHSGAIDGFRAHIKLVPKENLGIVLLNNRHGTDMNLALANTLVDRFLNLEPTFDWNDRLGKVAKMLNDNDKQMFKEREANRVPGTKPSLPNSAYVGRYVEPAFGEARVTEEDGKLVWNWSTFKCPLRHFHYDMFIADNEYLHDSPVSFALGLNGKPATMNAVERYFVRVQE